MFKIDWLQSFVRVADTRSFSEAARRSGLTAMAISKHIARLESELGEPLFERSTRVVRLTEFGGLFLERAEHLLREQAALADWVHSRHEEPSGVLKVMGMESALLALVVPHVSAFHERYPRIELHIDSVNELVDPVTRPFDIAWGVGRYLGDLHPGLVRRRLMTTDYGVFASPDYLQRYGVPNHPGELVDSHHRVLPQLHDEPNNFLIINDTGITGGDFPVCYLDAPVKTSAGHLELCIQGMGLMNASSDLPDVRRAVAAGRIVPVLEEYWFRSMDIYIYTHQVRQRQPKVDAFLAFFQERIGVLGQPAVEPD
ncbi:LysR family transcriptional regulator [Saccharospirillum salsuginis]|uniref:LysR family transcriptional regulator n=1 Tax=Saccharospirillum salsuginis TaxID=418750 RepID=A0A918NDA2_9GAMM|nr:LysR family transcriptional regulator [Saccharospirillum salsuginis]GGX59466.1 LysR family transcriptional regulator [Saccharospirillum salsuginis]